MIRHRFSPISSLAGLVVLAALATAAWNRGLVSRLIEPRAELMSSQCDGAPSSCPQLPESDHTGGSAEVVLSRADACVDVGYLCSELDLEGGVRVLRWPSTTERLRVVVPLPEESDPAYARELQQAALRGIKAWQGKPFPLIVATSDPDQRADIRIEWRAVLGNGQLGVTHTQWQQRGETTTFEILGLELATRSPHDPSSRLTIQQVALTAAHEMGHALGLPHSDRKSDVMFPTNTANNLSARDYRTIEAVYRLPNGAKIQENP